MGRSGTTLIDKLLSNHPKIDILSQPFPLIFVSLKKKYLGILGKDQYYVLNQHLHDENFSQDKFDQFLDNVTFDKNYLQSIFNNMKHYSGQTIKPSYPIVENLEMDLSSLDGIYKSSIELFDVKDSYYIGSKEIMCEEFLPYFIKNNYKTMLVYRDPRDIIASINYPKSKKYLGNKKPTLFLLRTWKKSIRYLNSLRGNKNFFFIKYEDLINRPYKNLNKITDFLHIPSFQDNQFDHGIYDRDGSLWNANTSKDKEVSSISSNSIESYKKCLSLEEIHYIESICNKDMKQLGYNFETTPSIKAISQFKDYDIEDSKELDKMFSSLKNNIDFEVMEFKENEDC